MNFNKKTKKNPPPKGRITASSVNNVLRYARAQSFLCSSEAESTVRHTLVCQASLATLSSIFFLIVSNAAWF